MVNNAACKLLGYSRKILLTQTMATIFNFDERCFKGMLKQRKAIGQSRALVTAIKKGGKLIRCEITSAIFKDEHGIERSVTSISDLSKSILRQKTIDTRKEKIVADNIILARTKQKTIDTIKEKTVADNIVLAKTKQKALENKLEKEIQLKEKQIANAAEDAKETERSDIAKELHDNINQLLGASRMYLTMAKRGGENSQMYLDRSSEYTLTAIEEIRKLTKGLTTDIIKKLGLCAAIEHITEDAMETTPIKISNALHGFSESSMNDKFKLNIYRIVQEQLNNILKHAQASEVAIRLLQNKRAVLLTITDNGVGFDTHKTRAGIGIENIKSRAVSYNGTAAFVSKPGQGCVLNVRFPVTALQAR